MKPIHHGSKGSSGPISFVSCHRRRPQTPVIAVKAARTLFEPLIAGSPHCNHLPFYVKVPDPASNDTATGLGDQPGSPIRARRPPLGLHPLAHVRGEEPRRATHPHCRPALGLVRTGPPESPWTDLAIGGTTFPLPRTNEHGNDRNRNQPMLRHLVEDL